VNRQFVQLLKATGESDQISLSDIESRLRNLTGGARDAIVGSRDNLLAAGVLGGVAFVAGSYLLGRRRGRRRATVLEIRRS
jgi:hypothetical protein